jgi:LPS-assembly protein
MNRLCVFILLTTLGPGLWLSSLNTAESGPIKRIDHGLDWGYCTPVGLQETTSTLIQPGTPGIVYMEADSAEYDQATQIIQLNQAAIRQDDTYLEAHRVRFHRPTKATQLEDEIYLEQPDLRITSHSGQIEMLNNTGWFSGVEYRLPEGQARGTAARIEILSETETRYEDVFLTTCPPGSRDWSLTASDMQLDQRTGWGDARQAVLRLGRLPVFYTPYFTFPIDDRRKSGFLFPSWGSSLDLGTELSLPYYFNLAPNYDATLTPHWMSRRGIMLGGEFRFLGQRHQGSLSGEILDDKVESELHDNRRSAIKIMHKSRPLPGLSTRIDAVEVSDMQYLDDFSSGLESSSKRHLERIAEARYRTGHWQLSAQLQDFQTVDQSLALADYPYSRMPSLTANYRRILRAYRTELGLHSAYTFFNHATKTTGQRINLAPTVSVQRRRPWGHLIPRLTLYQASYQLENADPGQPTDPSYRVPSLSLDSGLVFERASQWFGINASQTLEPRAYFLYAPYEDQTDIPVFDTSTLDLSFANLFRDNRFSGGDRVGDAKQITLGLTSRWLEDDTGLERLRASIGRIYYFQDRRVQLVGHPEEQSASAVVAELSSQLSRHWHTSLNLRWDPELEEKQIDKGRAGLHYRNAKQQLFNISYNYNTESKIEDLDISFYWRFNHRFSAMADWKHSIFYQRDLNRVLGLGYGGRCCWTLRALYQEYVNETDLDADIDQEADRRFMIQLELKGLGAVGQDIHQTLQESIYGYQPE